MRFEKNLATNVPNRFVNVSVSYNKGGVNYANGNTEKRGYYLHTRVEDHRDDGMVSSVLFNNGYKKLLKEVGRQSDKQFTQAVELVPNEVYPIVVATLAQRTDGLKLEEETEKQLQAGLFDTINSK